jgi:multidrug efflux pump
MISFNLAPGATAQAAIAAAQGAITMPIEVRGSFAGTAQSYQGQLGQQPLLIGAALVTI